MSDIINAETIKAITESQKPILDAKVSLPNSDVGAPYAVVPQEMSVVCLKSTIDKYATKPERRRGTASADRLESFVDLTNRSKDKDSVIFAHGKINGKSIEARLTAILDYNIASTENNDARFGEHRIVYDFPVSKEFKAWMALDGDFMEQEEFAFFLEDKINQLSVPNDEDKAVVQGLTPVFADPIQMLELSKGLELRSQEHVRKSFKTQTGETQIQYSNEHSDGDGQPLIVPNFFVVNIPVFEMGGRERIVVRLRYRVKQGAIKWVYDLYRPEDVFDAGFEGACEMAREKTELPLYIGQPERS